MNYRNYKGRWESLDVDKALSVQTLLDSGVDFDHVHLAFFSVQKLYCAFKLAESLQAEKSRIKSAVNKQIKNFEVNKGHIIRSILEHPFQKIVLDHLVIKDKLILKPNLVKTRVDNPLEYVFNDVFSNIMYSISFDKLLGVVFDLPDDKAAGFSGTVCKILFKILLNRISLAHSTFDVLQGDNFLVLKDTTIQSPIFAIGSNMQKVYDSVGWEHLRRSLVKIKMCDRFIKFFGGIYNGHVNRVMMNFGLMDEYQIHDSLDQEKVFLPLLWHIFYDPLLCKVKKQENVLGSGRFELVYDCLLSLMVDGLSVYTDGSLRGLESIDIRAGAVTFFENISLGLDVKVSGLMFSTLVELQAIALAFECIPLFSLVSIFMDS
ncbi:hypothetical protein G9A89_018240 [Geosiphon pyriformis]|nr:hypothetical protein G9A89_018240 [Geosiphon pyriformis]